jgi:hypothetical protein
MAQWHSVDLTNFDVAPVARTARRASEAAARRALDLAKDATYVSVGVGLLSFQRAQVQRREIERALRN